MKLLAAVFSIVILTTSIAFASPDIEKAKTMTVLIGQADMGSMAEGTGILLDSTHVLTCAHMVKGPRAEFLVYTYPLGRVVKAYAYAIDVKDDLAVLILRSSVPVSAVPMFRAGVQDGDAITVVGNALGGMKWFISRGIISTTDGPYLMSDALINPGNSGGPWLNEKGEIVALTSWRIGPEEHIPGMAGGIRAEWIIALLEDITRHEMAEKLQDGRS